MQRIHDRIADFADGKIFRQGHQNTWSEQRHYTPQGPIYHHAFKYSLYSTAQLQPCCTSVAGRRPWLAFRRRQCQRAVSHCKMQASYFSSHAFANSNSIFSAVLLCVMPPGPSYCEMLFTKVVSFCGIFIYLDWAFQVTQCEIKLWFMLLVVGLIRCQLKKYDFTFLNLCIQNSDSVTSSTNTVQPQWDDDVWNTKCLSLMCSGSHDAASVQ